MTESQRFPGVTRAFVVDIVPPRQESARATVLPDSPTPTTGCISVQPRALVSFWQGRAARLGVCLVLWLATGAYLLPFVDRGWIAHDDGMLGQAAERVMAGELPHRDFYDPYTGGLAYLHALGFKILGVRLVSLRWLLFAATLAWVPVVYFLAARFVPQ